MASTISRPAALLFPALVLGFLGASGWAQEAPDGERGLGADSGLTELVNVARRATDEDGVLVAALEALEVDVNNFAALAAQSYKARGVYDAFDVGSEEPLTAFHTALARFLLAPAAFFDEASKRDQRALAEALFDTRMRIRMAVFEDEERDAGEIRRGLTLLRANADGWVRLSEGEAQQVAGRVDLSAALMRARVKDLAALRESGESSEVASEDVERLLGILALKNGKERTALFDDDVLRVDRNAQAMGQVLFTHRLRQVAAEWIRWRDDLDRQAAKLAGEVRLWRPDTEEGKGAPPDVREIAKTKRRAEAYRRAWAGAAANVLDDELAYAIAYLSEFLDGALVTVDWYDRYLALRGIRSHDDRNWRTRTLTKEEQRALSQVQSFAPDGRGGGPGTPHTGQPGTGLPGTGTGDGGE